MNRRRFLRSGAVFATLGSSGLAGCTQLFTTGSQYAPPMVENRPDGVYIPSHKEGMEMAGMSGMDNTSSMDGMSGMNGTENNSSTSGMSGTKDQPGTLRCALTYSYPHRFWTVTGSDTEKVSIASDDTLHLMVSVWDAATGMYVMDTGPTITVSQDGEEVTTNTPWTMISQNMGFHAGDNVSLPEEGTYSATVDVPAVTTRRLRGFAGQFAEPQTFEFEFDYSREALENISFQRLDDRKGNRQAISPMRMDTMPLSTAPAAGSLPGRTLGRTKTADDIVFVATAIPDATDFDIDGNTYLAVSARTPYNRFVLPAMSLSGTLTRDGRRVFNGPLTPTLDPELDYHYGTGVDTVQAGDVLELSVETPPQVARHEGYETAFLQTATTRITVE